jgi:hypothetical protein
MGKAHQNQKKTAQLKSETNDLTTPTKVNTISRKKTAPVQSSTETHMDLWNLAVGDSFHFLHRNPAALSSKIL